MFRKRIIFIKIDTTGLDGVAAQKTADDIANQFKSTGFKGWWFKLWNHVIVLPTYEGDSSNIIVFN